MAEVETIKGIELRDGTIINKLVVTGRLYMSNKRFKNIYEPTPEGWRTAMMINLWNGSVWGVGAITGKRYLLKRVNN